MVYQYYFVFIFNQNSPFEFSVQSLCIVLYSVCVCVFIRVILFHSLFSLLVQPDVERHRVFVFVSVGVSPLSSESVFSEMLFGSGRADAAVNSSINFSTGSSQRWMSGHVGTNKPQKWDLLFSRVQGQNPLCLLCFPVIMKCLESYSCLHPDSSMFSKSQAWRPAEMSHHHSSSFIFYFIFHLSYCLISIY